jgi:hypothetical protein
MHEIPLNRPESSLSKRVTISTPTTGNGRFLRPGAELYGVITLRLEPYAGPAPFLLVWQVTEEQIPEKFFPGRASASGSAGTR